MDRSPREYSVRGPEGVLTACSDGDRAWLMYLGDDDACCFVSRDPDGESSTAVRRFRLENGQVDEYPESWTVPVAVAEDVLATFRRNGWLSDAVLWVDDYGTGARPPDPVGGHDT